MATRPTDRQPVRGRVDGHGRLVSAEPQLARLQQEAGSRIGAPLAVPQLAAIARIAHQLQIPVSRRAVAAAARQDIDMWVRAVPEGDEVMLTIERWEPRPPRQPRLATVGGIEPAPKTGPAHWRLDEQLRVAELSPAAADLFGVDAADAAGQSLTRLVRLEEAEDGAMPLLEALARRAAFDAQPVRRRGDDLRLLLTGEPVFDEQGGFSGFHGTLRGEEQAVPETSAIVDPAMNEVLRSPLKHIIESADRMAGGADGPLRREYEDYAADISAAAHHLLSVVRGISEEARGRRATVDLVELVSEAVGLVDSIATERQVAVGVEHAAGCTARGESRSIIQILVNLVGNGVRYSYERGTVTVSFERSGDQAIVHVADDGPGIDAADQERIFERFEQAGQGTGQGTGLGLAISRRLARQMGGDILLASRPGVGSRFSLVLPAA
ncbi:PAS domain-containing sensor histidine kinase [Sphingomonas sinipercae]|uniref:histidine kinase n=1 Tax=Sphingomonas sinipercae TaxID=2714944 RepID=A0A6G7ZMS5_9SPHN|nr:PAS domain-containing sensor histidine kinase [Sphingomonas sinipercae]QIL02219.1 PAS domain-containing sensor histidine kinase [Sphingomonas sinipercae]